MRFLSLLLLAPILAVLGWMYLRYAASQPRSALVRFLDHATVWLAAIGAVVACLAVHDATPLPGLEPVTGVRASGAIWQQVAPALWGYGVFTGVLFAALGLRRWRR